MTDTLHMYALGPAGLRELEQGREVAELNDAFASLPLGVYEGLRTFGRTGFVGLAEHLARLGASARAAGLTLPAEAGELRRSLDEITRAFAAENSGDEAVLRIDILPDAVPPEMSGTGGEFIALGIAPLRLLTGAERGAGLCVKTTRALARAEPLIKDAQFVLDRKPYFHRTEKLYDHLMVSPDGALLEGTRSNFFGVRDGVLYTAPEGVLMGITRAIVLQIAREAGFEAHELAVQASAVAELEEAFYVGSVQGVVPVTTIDAQSIGDGTPGPVTSELASRYDVLTRETARPASI